MVAAPAHRHRRFSQHGSLGQRFFQTSGLIGQPPVLAGSNHQFNSMLLADLEWLVKVRFPIGHIDPPAPSGRPPGRFNPGCPSLRFARPAQPLVTRISCGRRPRTPTFLVEQAHRRSFRSLFQRPGLDPYRQRLMQFNSPPPSPMRPGSSVCGWLL